MGTSIRKFVPISKEKLTSKKKKFGMCLFRSSEDSERFMCEKFFIEI